jgi:hypothetical protein
MMVHNHQGNAIMADNLYRLGLYFDEKPLEGEKHSDDKFFN